ncbi:NACHT, LRR and PYD domains-containing protein 3-like isoform X2 [Elgaria multicarinata webbii]
MEARAAMMQDLLLNALEGLGEDDLKKFKFKLRNTETPTGRNIPIGRLEEADREQLAQLLVEFYEDKASALMATIFEDMGLKLNASEHRKAVGKRVQDYKKKYAENVKEDYEVIEDKNCRLGENIPLNERYVELLIIRKHRSQKQREHELVATGRLHMEILESNSADYASIDIESLFEPDASGRTPRTVVLQGPAGIGKTMTVQKIMLGWAVGQLYSDVFDYVFCIRCRELVLAKEANSLADLIAEWYGDSQAPVEEILAHPEKLLFIIDGFDELHCFLETGGDHWCNDPYSKVSMEGILSSLLRKKLLPKSYLLITTRPGSVERLQECLKFPRFSEILGFSKKGREEYFSKFFEDQRKANIALRFIENTTAVSTICFIPMVCWIICSVIKKELETKDEIVDIMDTTTKVFIQFSHKLLEEESKKRKMFPLNEFRKLCSLARAGMLEQKILFEEQDLKEHNLDVSALRDLFLDRRTFQKVIGQHNLYSFLHLCFQEFFAAMWYFLQQEPTGEPANTEDLKRLLVECEKPGNEHLTLTMCFLFGLSNEDVRTFLEQTLQCRTSDLVKPLLFQKAVEIAAENPPQEGYSLLKFFHCLFESQEAEFAKCVMHHFQIIDLSSKTLSVLDCRVLAFCLQHSTIKDHSLDLTFCRLKSHHIKALGPGIKNCATLEFGSNKLGNSGVHVLCTFLKELDCNMTTLNLAENYLTDACAQELCTTLSTSQALYSLHLHDNSFTAASVSFIQHLIETCTSLSIIHLGSNCFGDKGRKYLEQQGKKLTKSGRRFLFWM